MRDRLKFLELWQYGHSGADHVENDISRHNDDASIRVSSWREGNFVDSLLIIRITN